MGPHSWIAGGVHGEFAHIGYGLWTNLGATVNLDGHLAGNLGVGWSFFGAEARVQQVAAGDPVLELYGKLRIPVRLLIMAFK